MEYRSFSNTKEGGGQKQAGQWVQMGQSNGINRLQTRQSKDKRGTMKRQMG